MVPVRFHLQARSRWLGTLDQTRVRGRRRPVVKDHVEIQPKPQANSTNVLVEMQPGNIVVYKFIDEASGRLIQQIPAEQLLNLSQPAERRQARREAKTWQLLFSTF